MRTFDNTLHQTPPHLLRFHVSRHYARFYRGTFLCLCELDEAQLLRTHCHIFPQVESPLKKCLGQFQHLSSQFLLLARGASPHSGLRQKLQNARAYVYQKISEACYFKIRTTPLSASTSIISPSLRICVEMFVPTTHGFFNS